MWHQTRQKQYSGMLRNTRINTTLRYISQFNAFVTSTKSEVHCGKRPSYECHKHPTPLSNLWPWMTSHWPAIKLLLLPWRVGGFLATTRPVFATRSRSLEWSWFSWSRSSTFHSCLSSASGSWTRQKNKRKFQHVAMAIFNDSASLLWTPTFLGSSSIFQMMQRTNYRSSQWTFTGKHAVHLIVHQLWMNNDLKHGRNDDNPGVKRLLCLVSGEMWII